MEYFLIQEGQIFLNNFPFQYRRINSVEKVEIDSEQMEGFIVAGASESFFEEACRSIRNVDFSEVYLKPVVFVSEKKLTPRIANMADMIFNLRELGDSDLKKRFKKIDRINNAIRRINLTKDTKKDDLFLRILRFIYTRGKKIKPVRDRTSFFGITYPSIECFFSKEDYALFNTLEFLEENGSIEGSFFEKVHFCNRCYCSFLNFIEVCPNCGSADLIEENLIHHFPCAYVGPESDFARGSQLICPKCSKRLKGLGVDYDRPGVIHKCNNCGFVAQETEVKTICFNCEKESSPEDLIIRTIKIYTLTSVGENFAIYGFESPLLRAFREQLNILPYDSFLTVIHLELERSKRYGVVSSLVAFQIVNLNNIYAKLGAETDKLLKEIASLIKAATRNSDVLAILNEGVVLLLLPHTSLQGANVVKERLVSEISQLIRENVGIKPVIRGSTQEISENNVKEPDRLVEELLKGLRQFEDEEV